MTPSEGPPRGVPTFVAPARPEAGTQQATLTFDRTDPDARAAHEFAVHGKDWALAMLEASREIDRVGDNAGKYATPIQAIAAVLAVAEEEDGDE